MREKLEKKDSKTETMISVMKSPETRKRGRPKGAKNKPKQIQPVVESEFKPKKRGRPKGAKNKPKEPSYVAPAAPKPRGRPKKVTVEPVASSQPQETNHVDTMDDHPLVLAAKWLEKNMHQHEMQYYRTRASRNGVPLNCAIVSDILGFFNVQNADICKQIKKNNFIASTSNGLPNQD
jgi:hypothetical protein